MSKLLQSFLLALLTTAAVVLLMALVAGIFILMDANPRLAGELIGAVSFAILWRYAYERIEKE